MIDASKQANAAGGLERNGEQPKSPSRRSFGKLLGLASVVPLAGCFGGGGGDNDNEPAGSTTGTSTTGSSTTSSSYAISSDAKVTVTGGVIQGINMSTGVRAFLGVPYAAPPVGNLRWKAPQPVVPWSGTKSTQTNPPAAIKQSAPLILPAKGNTVYPASEDCLYLNVWTPPEAKAKAGGLPVLVWIHGGGSNIVEPRYEGDEFAKRGVIKVNIARRQSLFANLALAELSAEPENKGSSGNFEILDMIAALKWVQENIAKFGGDPNNVTIGGQSMGSVYTTSLQATPLAAGLFKRVMGSACYMFKGSNAKTTGTTLAAAQANGAAWMAKFGTVAGTTPAKSVADLRAKTVEELYLVTGTSFATEVIDNYVYPDTVQNLFLDGKQSKVPAYTGYVLYDTGFTTVTDVASYNAYLTQNFGTNASAVFNLYPAFNNADAVNQANRLATERANGMRNVSYARLQSRSNSPTYIFRFDRGNSTSPTGAKHSWDINYWHYKLSAAISDGSLPYQTAADYDLSSTMVDSLIAYCTNGNPSTPDLTVPKYDRNDEKMVVLDITTASIPVSAGMDWFAENPV